jgi:DNA repair protein RecO (recombination protein O)
MHWSDDAIILNSRKQGEQSLIVSVLTPTHGRAMGLAKGGAAKAGVTLPGNQVSARWQARLSEHLGMWTFEMQQPVAALLLHDRARIEDLQHVCLLMHRHLPEREPHPWLYGAFRAWQTLALSDIVTLAQLEAATRLLEVVLLQVLGFGLALSECADTGTKKDLVYLSPKTGRAVCRTSGTPYHDRMLALPRFMQQMGGSDQLLVPSDMLETDALPQAHKITRHFLEKCREF